MPRCVGVRAGIGQEADIKAISLSCRHHAADGNGHADFLAGAAQVTFVAGVPGVFERVAGRQVDHLLGGNACGSDARLHRLHVAAERAEVGGRDVAAHAPKGRFQRAIGVVLSLHILLGKDDAVGGLFCRLPLGRVLLGELRGFADVPPNVAERAILRVHRAASLAPPATPR